MPIVRHIVLVGHCGFDASTLTSLAESAVPGCVVIRVNDEDNLGELLDQTDLMLINRALDGRFSTDSGVELIRMLANEEDPPPMMLVSNYPEAQAQAIAAGALPGFGKSSVARPETAQALATACDPMAWPESWRR